MCKKVHFLRELCINYSIGFCPEGPNCKFIHVKSLINSQEDNFFYLTKYSAFDSNMETTQTTEVKNYFNNINSMVINIANTFNNLVNLLLLSEF